MQTDISRVRWVRASIDVILMLDASGANVDDLKATYPDYELEDMWRSGELSTEELERMKARRSWWQRWFG